MWGQTERPAPKKTKRAGRWSDNYELAVAAMRSATTAATAAMKSATTTVRAAYAAVEATATAATMVAATGRAAIAVRG